MQTFQQTAAFEQSEENFTKPSLHIYTYVAQK